MKTFMKILELLLYGIVGALSIVGARSLDPGMLRIVSTASLTILALWLALWSTRR